MRGTERGLSANDGEAGENDYVASDIENLTGGSGDDLLSGNAAANLLDGGPGNANGFDTVDYSERTAAIAVDLDGAAGDDDDGATGEGDTVAADIEAIRGGSGNDVLMGNGADNLLDGGPGADVLGEAAARTWSTTRDGPPRSLSPLTGRRPMTARRARETPLQPTWRTCDPTAASTNIAWYVEYFSVCRPVGTSGTAFTMGRQWHNDIDDGAAAIANLTAALNTQVFGDVPVVATIGTTIAKALSSCITPSVATGSMTCHIAILETLT